MQVISQRALGIYHMSPPCPSAWDCEADGKTPKKSFEEHALLEVCSDKRHCEEPVVGALEAHWLTFKGARLLRTACRRSLSHRFIGEDPGSTHATDALLRGVSRSYGGNGGSPTPSTEAGGSDAEADASDADGGGGDVEASDADADASGADADGGEDGKDKQGGKKGAGWRRLFPGNCFPGEAAVLVAPASGGGSCGSHGERDVAMADLRVGDLVLTERRPGDLAFEPVLGFLHVVRGGAQEFLSVVHEFGQFRASPGHLVFVASAGGRQDKAVQELRAGDALLFAPPGLPRRTRPSQVLSVSRGVSTAGMYAPLTASGTIVVDAVLASNYAVPSPGLRLPHWLAHAALLPLRASHSLGLRQLLGLPQGAQESPAEPGEELHPVLDFMCRRAGALALLRAVQPALTALS